MVENENSAHNEATTENLQAIKTRVEALVTARRYEDAIRVIRERLNPRDSDSNYLLGLAAYYTNDFDRAYEGFRASLAESPNARAFYGFGLTLRRRGRMKEARKAFEAALRLNPKLKKAEIQIAEIAKAEDSAEQTPGPAEPRDEPHPNEPPSEPRRPNRPPTSALPRVEAGDRRGAETAARDESVFKSLADMLDFRSAFRPTDKDLAGRVVWSSAPSLRSLIGPLILALMLLLAPVLLHQLAGATPAGLVGAFAAWIWRVSEAVALPTGVFILIRSFGLWATTLYVLHEHRIEIFTGIINRQHVVIWLHDLERPISVRQNLWQLLVGTGAIQIESTILPSSSRRRRSNTGPNQVLIKDLGIKMAEHVSARIRADVMWQRRRMVQNFVSSR